MKKGWIGLNRTKIFLALSLFLIICGIDYVVLEDIFRDGKYRYMLFALVPVAYIFFKRHLHWAPALFFSMMLFQWVLRSYTIMGGFKVILVLATLSFAAVLAKQDPSSLGKMLIFPGVLQASYAILQKLNVHLLFTPNEVWAKTMASGTMGHETILGPMLVCCLAPALWYRYRISAALMVTAIICTGSTMGVLSMVAVLLTFLWHKTSFKTAFSCGLIFCSLLIALYFVPWARVENNDFYSITGRGPVWASAWRGFQQHWFFGGGPGYWMGTWMPRDLGVLGSMHVALQVHCDPLELLVEYGLVTFLPLLWALWRFCNSFRPTWHHAVVAGILVNSLGNFPMQIVPIALIFIVAWVYSNREYNPLKDDGRHELR